jgi:hypothetical protein
MSLIRLRAFVAAHSSPFLLLVGQRGPRAVLGLRSMTNRVLASLIGAAIAGMPAISSATAVASAYIQDERMAVSAPPQDVGDVTATQTAGAIGSGQYAIASADASTGKLRTVTQAGLDGPYLMPAAANSSITETLQFSSGYGQIGYLDWTYDGSFTLAGSSYPQAAMSQFLVRIENTINPTVGMYQTLTLGECGANTGCEIGTEADRSGTLEFLINQYDFTFFSALSAFSTYGNLVDFGNTATLNLRLPDGVTFTSTSGQFLAGEDVPSTVPEPATSALVVAALGVLSASQRKRKVFKRPMRTIFGAQMLRRHRFAAA